MSSVWNVIPPEIKVYGSVINKRILSSVYLKECLKKKGFDCIVQKNHYLDYVLALKG